MTFDEAVQKQIDEIMDNFDFSRVATMMEAVHWGWGIPPVVPEEPEIRTEARRHLRQAVENGSSACSGFTACCEKAEDEGGKWVRLTLQWGPGWDDDGVHYE